MGFLRHSTPNPQRAIRRLKIEIMGYQGREQQLRAEIRELRARLDDGAPGAVERYREALRWIATYGENEGDLLTGHEDAMRNIARVTLGGG